MLYWQFAGFNVQIQSKILDLLNKDEPWYPSCRKCHKKVKCIYDVAACNNWNIENVEYEMRLGLVITQFNIYKSQNT